LNDVIWHDAECGSYTADLPLWEELAAQRGGPVLDLGCGTGRVMSHLVRRGHEVLGLDLDPRLIATLADAEPGDALNFELGRRFGLVLAPMQLMQLFGSQSERVRCLKCVATHLAPGGLAAFAIVESMPTPVDGPPPLPDSREVDGWVYSSLPIDAIVESGTIRVRRLRQTVSPQGELEEELYEIGLRELDAATLESEAREAGLKPAGRRTIPPTDAHVGSTVVLLERGA
jgi:SAM-dependent methyltransferase